MGKLPMKIAGAVGVLLLIRGLRRRCGAGTSSADIHANRANRHRDIHANSSPDCY